ncbi:MAG: tripeptide aminopeptidase [Actinomycetota bacterium]|nr:tripeptide aminopeptidase [Actinomycetota bacterium]
MARTLGAIVDEVIARTREICAVPGPPFDEADRAAIVRSWWSSDGLADVHSDSAGNLWARARAGSGAAPGAGAVVVAAHLDTVFDRGVVHETRIDGGRLIGPGVGDDSVALAALASVAELLAPGPEPVWLLATVGEEGAGNLRGARAALAAPPEPLKAFVALEGNYLGRICTVAVGSHRERIEISGPGGHAWEASAAPNAIHAAAALVDDAAGLAGIDEYSGARSSVNVGSITGGEAINARARHCSFEVDLRSDDPGALDRLVAGFALACEAVATAHAVTIHRFTIGERPAGRLALDDPLVLAAVDGLALIGRTPEYVAASTDANAAHAAGVPAVALGITEGAGEHTEQEWISLDPIADGLRALHRTIELASGGEGEVGPGGRR